MITKIEISFGMLCIWAQANKADGTIVEDNTICTLSLPADPDYLIYKFSTRLKEIDERVKREALK